MIGSRIDRKANCIKRCQKLKEVNQDRKPKPSSPNSTPRRQKRHLAVNFYKAKNILDRKRMTTEVEEPLLIPEHYLTDTINDVQVSIDDRERFEKFSASWKESFDNPAIMRLCKWFRLFSDNYSRCVCFYSAGIFALIDAFEKGNLLLTQTDHEREVSFSFYEKLFNSKAFMATKDVEVTKYLLTLALVYGRYPGMQIRPMGQAFGILANQGLTKRSLHEVFEYLFVKYENPKILTHNLSYLQLPEIDALMFTLQGNNIGDYPGLPVEISKKTSFFLVNKVPVIPFKKEVLKRAVAVAQLVRLATDPELLHRLLTGSKVFTFKIDTFLQDIAFWQDAYLILTKVDWEMSYLSVQEFVDYFEYHRYDVGQGNFSLKRRTPNSVSRAIEEWHQSLDEENRLRLMSETWKRLENTEEKYEIVFMKDRYTFEEITSGKALAEESDVMKHCVFSYLSNCISRYSSIWSMKKAVGDDFKHHLTIEVTYKEIVQVSGKRNARPKPRDIRVITEWAGKAGFTVSVSEGDI